LSRLTRALIGELCPVRLEHFETPVDDTAVTAANSGRDVAGEIDQMWKIRKTADKLVLVELRTARAPLQSDTLKQRSTTLSEQYPENGFPIRLRD
jgi:hypothetical protein